jgi:hypothetical protein
VDVIVVKVDSIRKALRNARVDLSNRIWAGQQVSRTSPTLKGNSFFTTLGNENGMIVKIDRLELNNNGASIPVISQVEFKDEASYAWFMLKWA